MVGPQALFASVIIEGNTIEHIMNASLQAWIILFYLALVMNVVGYSIWYSLLKKHPVNSVMPVLLLFPITGLLTAIFVLKENPNTYAYIGGAIIIAGVSIILINIKQKKI